jgi:hypothetical protein
MHEKKQKKDGGSPHSVSSNSSTPSSKHKVRSPKELITVVEEKTTIIYIHGNLIR